MLNSGERNKIKRLLAIDGKTQKVNHIVSTVDERRLCLCQKRMEKKTNEIKAAPELLDCLNIKGTVVTTDAIGAQKEIAKKIHSKRTTKIQKLVDIFRRV